MRAAAVIIAATLVLTSPVRAGCNFSDVADAVKQSVSATLTCKSVCKEEVSCAGAIWLVAVLTGIAAEGGQGKVDTFCAQAQGKLDQIASTANTVFGNALAQKYFGDMSDQLAAVASAAEVVKCACETQHSNVASQDSVGVCLMDALCAMQEWVGFEACNCSPPPPKAANCAATNLACGKWNNPDPVCQGSGSNPIFSWYPDGQTQAHYNPYYDDYRNWTSVTTTPEGTLITQTPSPSNKCGQTLYCFCPAPMKPVFTKVNWVGHDLNPYILSCACPDKTHAGPMMPNGISSCLCDNTNEPAIMSGLAPFGMCPPAACPAGQVRLGGVGECVTPCADASQGMGFDGSCCNPAQMSTCGTCCPPSTVPDPKSGTCVPRPQPPK
ncbi:hypothetical protein RA307_00125 [Xanthobacteraceae bacterium Astr-EGSB]|uniref:hypothetical protein n=1 Tax=Astrobacterium formosum TaxID=3069710 RepID=UPI0027B397B4|nr:hypothetical protein [Xanthobacteraceae bacterium Astr-EGSB]